MDKRGRGENSREILESAEAAEGGVYTDGSRIERRTAAATITKAEYLGRYATVMDVEMLAIAMGWDLGHTVITDSQAAIGVVMASPVSTRGRRIRQERRVDLRHSPMQKGDDEQIPSELNGSAAPSTNSSGAPSPGSFRDCPSEFGFGPIG